MTETRSVRCLPRQPDFRAAAGVATVAAVLSLTPATRAAPTARPNVLVVLTDDQGWGDLSCNGNTNLSTPHMDSLARAGVSFERFYVCPVCAPTRAEFLTGRYHSRGGVRGVSTGAERLNLDEKTIADTFLAAGYATAAFGKWHNGTQYPYHPNARGFQEFYGFCSGHWGQYFDPELEHNGQLTRGTGFLADDLTDHAMQFMERHRSEPFFCYVPYNIPHTPFQVPERFYGKFRDAPIALRYHDPGKEKVERTRAALALCENLDWNLGRLLAKLAELKLEENTIVVFFSDNGPNGARYNGGMKGVKGSTDEGGVRLPCFIRWPGHLKAGVTIPQIAGAIDLLPTLADLAGIRRVGDKPLDGRSLRPLLEGNASDWPDRLFITHHRGRVSVRSQRFRLDAQGKLFDMVNDPGQKQPVNARFPKEAARLAKAVAKYKEEVLAPLGPDERPFPVGYRALPTAYLPARDGVAHGGVKRSAKAPNCSFFTNWKNTEGSMTWDVEVATSGAYEATVYYTCPADSVGSVVELSFNGAKVSAKVDEAHDPPLVGAEFDRVQRGSESYVKDFKPLGLGTVTLKAGRGLLTLRALETAGGTVMDVRAVALTLKD